MNPLKLIIMLREVIVEDMALLIDELTVEHPLCIPHQAIWKSAEFKTYAERVRQEHRATYAQAACVPKTMYEQVVMSGI
jgi:hypothetical protein